MSNISKFLINEPFIEVSRALTLELKLSPAIVLQKLHSLTINSNSFLATYKDWHDEIPFLSDEQLKKILIKLNDKGYITSEKLKGSRARQYSINNKYLSSQGFETVGHFIMPTISSDKYMLFILPTLAKHKKIGIAASIILQHMHYLIKNNPIERVGYSWCEVTYPIINLITPFISLRQIMRIFKDFRKNNLIIFESSNKDVHNSVNFYRINYEQLDVVLKKPISKLSAENQNQLLSPHNIHEGNYIQDRIKDIQKRMSISDEIINDFNKLNNLIQEIASQNQLLSPPNEIADDFNELGNLNQLLSLSKPTFVTITL